MQHLRSSATYPLPASEMSTMTNVDLGRYKRIVQYFWDPEPKNDDTARLPIWCLGKKYTSSLVSEPDCPPSRPNSPSGQVPPQGLAKPSVEEHGNRYAEETEGERRGLHTVRGSGSEDESGWPPTFLDDFESRIWFTYRSNFPSITRSPDPNASSAMSLSVRIRSQLVDHGGFTSDTGWGCMIRSGQCLLANALLMLRLGRGMIRLPKPFGDVTADSVRLAAGNKASRGIATTLAVRR